MLRDALRRSATQRTSAPRLARCACANWRACARRWRCCLELRRQVPEDARAAGRPSRHADAGCGHRRAALHRAVACGSRRCCCVTAASSPPVPIRTWTGAPYLVQLRRLPAGDGGAGGQHRHPEPAGAVQQGARLHIEVTSNTIDRVPLNYQRRQTLKNAERFITPEPRPSRTRRSRAGAGAGAEKWLWGAAARTRCSRIWRALSETGPRVLASLDVHAALAERARTPDWCRPDFVPQPCIEIERGRHPVVEARLAESAVAASSQRLLA